MRTWQVHLLKSGVGKDVTVQAQSQSEAHRLAESQNPGFKASSSREMH